MKSPACLFLLLPLALAACGGDSSTPTPTPGPGTLTAQLAGPTTAEGAARVRLVGPGIGAVTANGGRLFHDRKADTVNVVLALETPGTLSFRVALADTTRRPVATIIEVAGPDDEIRTGLSAYAVEWIR